MQRAAIYIDTESSCNRLYPAVCPRPLGKVEGSEGMGLPVARQNRRVDEALPFPQNVFLKPGAAICVSGFLFVCACMLLSNNRPQITQHASDMN